MRVLLAVGLSLIPLWPLTALAGEATVSAQTTVSHDSSVSQHKIVEIKGVELPGLDGNAFSDLTLFAANQGVLIPIAAQFEDYDDEGYSWFRESTTPLRGREGLFDPHDSLLFRFADAGQRLEVPQSQHSQGLVEIRITDGDETRYVYVARQTARFTHAPMASYDAQTGQIRTDYFALQTAPDNLLQWSDFTYRNFQGLPGKTLLDTLKIRLQAGVILDGARVTLDNEDLDTRLVATKSGPIRTTLLAEARMRFAGIPVVAIDLQLQVYPKQINIDAKVNVPSALKRLLKNPTASVTLDGHNLNDSLLLSSVSTIAVTVDGQMSEAEQALGRDNIGQHPWIWLSSQKGFDIFATLYIPPNFSVPVNLIYQDTVSGEDPPERFPGQGPNVGFHMQDVPVNDTFRFAFQAWFTDTLTGVPPRQLANALSNMPKVAVQKWGGPASLRMRLPDETASGQQ